MTSWIEKCFRRKKPVIAMAHIPALPGTPRYDSAGGISHLIDWVRADVEKLIQGGVDGIMFCNEDDRPYLLNAGIEQIAAMTRVVAELAPEDLPFGVDFLWDPMAAIAIAHATGAAFMREVLTGVYESDMGLWAPDAAKFARFRHQIGAANIRVFYNVVPEFSSPLGSRTVEQRTRSAVVSSLADGILVSGAMAGDVPDLTLLKQAKAGAANEVPVFLNTGASVDNIFNFLEVADGVIVGSSLKKDGHTWNPVEPKRVDAFMKEVQRAREAN
jgi:membrane complex biogenesis BtpA family protein